MNKKSLLKIMPRYIPLLVILMFTVFVLTFVNSKLKKELNLYRQDFLLAIENANFSSIEIEDGALITDIKPKIFNFVLENTQDKYFAFVVDPENLLNPYFWNREDKASVKGIMFNTKDITVIKDERRISFPYSKLVRGGKWEKGEVLEKVSNFKYSILVIDILLIALFSILTYLIVLIVKLVRKLLKTKKKKLE